MPEFVRLELRRTLKCTLVLRHIMVLLRIRVNVPLTLTRGPGHETKKRQTDMDILLSPPSPQRTAQYEAGCYLDGNTSSGQVVAQAKTTTEDFFLCTIVKSRPIKLNSMTGSLYTMKEIPTHCRNPLDQAR